MKIKILCFLFLFAVMETYAQKDVSQTLDASGIQNIFIKTDEVFKINIKTEKSQVIQIISHSQGEYFDQISLETEVAQNTLMITSQYREILQSGYDKLSAHKVFSLEITLIIPENLQVLIESNIASVEAMGIYKNLSVQLKEGYCQIKDFTGNAQVNTYSGFIEVHTKNSAVSAESRNGKVKNIPVYPGKNTLQLKSVNGDIRVSEN